MRPPERTDQREQRSAGTNAALGILAATPFLEAGAELAKEWVQDKLSHEPPPKIELPPGVDRE